MKRKNVRRAILLSLMLTLLLLCSLPLGMLAQVSYKGQLHVGNASFTVQGTLLRVRMSVSYDRDLLNRGETLVFTPVLKDAKQQQELSSVVIVGKGNGNRVRGNYAVAVAGDGKGKYFFDYDATIPYSDWMQDAAMYVESEERDSSGKAHVFEDRVFTSLRISDAPLSTNDNVIYSSDATSASRTLREVGEVVAPVSNQSSMGGNGNTSVNGTNNNRRAQKEWVQVLEPARYPENELTVKGVIALDDERHLLLLSNKKFNAAIADEIYKQLSDFLQVPGTSLSRLTLSGYGAPVGNYRSNELQSTARAMELKAYLLTMQGQAPASVNISWVAEDWEGIRDIIALSDLRLKDAAIDIIRNVEIAAGREKQVRMLDGGLLYSRLQQIVFPQVCRLEYTAVMSRDAAISPDTPANALSLTDIWRTAQGFEKGSDDYNDLLDLAARLYPGNGVACINAAGVALMRGDLNRAAELLSGFETDPRAYNNYGVLHFLKGDKDKAEVYLMMAEANEVPEATTVLNEINN